MNRPVGTNAGIAERMRLYVSADMEGLAGVVSRDDLMPGRFEYGAARDWVTDAVISVCEAAREMAVREAMRRVGTASAPEDAAPMLLEMRLRTRLVAEWLSYLPQVARTDAFTVAYRANDITAASRFIGFLSTARLALA
jgi:D-aminopeptidase